MNKVESFMDSVETSLAPWAEVARMIGVVLYWTVTVIGMIVLWPFFLYFWATGGHKNLGGKW